jgi:LysM repeat protein
VIRRRGRARSTAGGSRSSTSLAVGIGVLALVVVAAVFGLSLLDVGREGRRTETLRAHPSSPTTSVTEATTTTTVGEPSHYTVRSGDSLLVIARRFGVSTESIVKANALANADRLTVGQTLLIPPKPALRLAVTPTTVAAGGSVQISLTGAKPSEKVTFQIDSPAGSFTGPAHVASSDGKVVASYAPAAGNPAGTYTITAHGDQGTTAVVSLVVDAP